MSLFHDEIDRWVLAGLKSTGGDKVSLFHVLPGFYPKEVLDSFERLIRANKIGPRVPQLQLAQRQHLKEQPSLLPTPHPLDYDWRFSGEGKKVLLNLLGQTKDLVALLGCPSLFEAAVNRRVKSKLWLLDNNAASITSLERNTSSRYKAVCLDLSLGILPEVKVNAVFADPPWYPEYMKVFSHAASRLVINGGMYYLCMPPAGTRPRAETENKALIRYCKNLGFTLISYEKGIIPYTSPRFEANALAAEGVYEYPETWRRGDLATFRLQNRTSLVLPIKQIHHPWQEERFSGMRLKLRIKYSSDYINPSLTSLVDGDVLPSVSRRHPLRQHVDVWTSGNRVFACQNTSILRVIIRSHSKGMNIQKVVSNHLGRTLGRREERMICRASEQLESLQRTETMECSGWIVNA